MKTIAILILAIGFLSLQFAFAEEGNADNEKKLGDNSNMEMNYFPYAKTDIVPMLALFQKDEYTVYRVEAIYVKTLQTCQPVGKVYNYFVYKNGQFMLTVNHCNKEKVFGYLTEENVK